MANVSDLKEKLLKSTESLLSKCNGEEREGKGFSPEEFEVSREMMLRERCSAQRIVNEGEVIPFKHEVRILRNYGDYNHAWIGFSRLNNLRSFCPWFTYLYAFGTNEKDFIVQDPRRGMDLAAFISSADTNDVKNIYTQVITAVSWAHGKGVANLPMDIDVVEITPRRNNPFRADNYVPIFRNFAKAIVLEPCNRDSYPIEGEYTRIREYFFSLSDVFCKNISISDCDSLPDGLRRTLERSISDRLSSLSAAMPGLSRRGSLELETVARVVQQHAMEIRFLMDCQDLPVRGVSSECRDDKGGIRSSSAHKELVGMLRLKIPDLMREARGEIFVPATVREYNRLSKLLLRVIRSRIYLLSIYSTEWDPDEELVINGRELRGRTCEILGILREARKDRAKLELGEPQDAISSFRSYNEIIFGDPTDSLINSLRGQLISDAVSCIEKKKSQT